MFQFHIHWQPVNSPKENMLIEYIGFKVAIWSMWLWLPMQTDKSSSCNCVSVYLAIGFPTGSVVKKFACNERSLAGYSPQGCKELDTMKQLSTHSHSFQLWKHEYLCPMWQLYTLRVAAWCLFQPYRQFYFEYICFLGTER